MVCVVTSLEMALFTVPADVLFLLESSIGTAHMQAAAQGYYCPDATTILPCPEGKFCKWWTRHPKSCPWLATCPHGSTSADLSLAGFFFMLLILLLLWLAYVACDAYIRSVCVLLPKSSVRTCLCSFDAALICCCCGWHTLPAMAANQVSLLVEMHCKHGA